MTTAVDTARAAEIRSICKEGLDELAPLRDVPLQLQVSEQDVILLLSKILTLPHREGCPERGAQRARRAKAILTLWLGERGIRVGQL